MLRSWVSILLLVSSAAFSIAQGAPAQGLLHWQKPWRVHWDNEHRILLLSQEAGAKQIQITNGMASHDGRIINFQSSRSEMNPHVLTIPREESYFHYAFEIPSNTEGHRAFALVLTRTHAAPIIQEVTFYEFIETDRRGAKAVIGEFENSDRPFLKASFERREARFQPEEFAFAESTDGRLVLFSFDRKAQTLAFGRTGTSQGVFYNLPSTAYRASLQTDAVRSSYSFRSGKLQIKGGGGRAVSLPFPKVSSSPFGAQRAWRSDFGNVIPAFAWDFGSVGIRALSRRHAGRPIRKTPSVPSFGPGLAEDVKSWLEHAEPLRTGNHDGFLLHFSVSPGLFQFYPRLRSEMIDRIMNPLEQFAANRSEESVFLYFRLLSSKFDVKDAQQLGDIIKQQLGNSGSDRHQSYTILLDVVDALKDPSESHKFQESVVAFSSALGRSLPKTIYGPRRTAHVITILPRSNARHLAGEMSLLPQKIQLERHLSLDRYLKRSAGLAFVRDVTGNAHPVPPHPDLVERIFSNLESLRERGQLDFDPFADWEETASLIKGSLLTSVTKLKATNETLSIDSEMIDPRLVESVIESVVRSTNIMSVSPFPFSVLQSVEGLHDWLSPQSPRRGPELLFDQEAALSRATQRIESYVTSGYKHDPFLLLALFGPQGSGKSSFPQAFINRLGNDVASVTIDFNKDLNGKEAAEDIIQHIQKESEKLDATKGIRVVVLDEVFTRPHALKALMNGFTLEGDQSSSSARAFMRAFGGGRIIHFTGNLDTTSDSYPTLLSLQTDDPKYIETLKNVLVDTLVKREMDRQEAIALADRLLLVSIVFQPATEQGIRDFTAFRISEFLRRKSTESVQFKMASPTLKAIQENMIQYRTANYRSVKGGLDRLLNQLFSSQAYDQIKNNSEAEGIFVIDGTPSRLRLQTDQTPKTLEALYDSAYTEARQDVIQYLEGRAQELRDRLKRGGAPVLGVEALRYEAIIRGIREASADKPEFCFPACDEHQVRAKSRALLDRARELLNARMGTESARGDAQFAIELMREIDDMMERELASTAPRRFVSWIHEVFTGQRATEPAGEFTRAYAAGQFVDEILRKAKYEEYSSSLERIAKKTGLESGSCASTLKDLKLR